MRTLTQYQTTVFCVTMVTYGGHFAGYLANAWAAADLNNQARLCAAFPDLIERYGPDSECYKRVEGDAKYVG